MNSRLQEHEVTARNDAATARVGTSFLAPPPRDTRVSALRLRTLRMQSAQADFVLLLQRFQPPGCEVSIPLGLHSTCIPGLLRAHNSFRRYTTRLHNVSSPCASGEFLHRPRLSRHPLSKENLVWQA